MSNNLQQNEDGRWCSLCEYDLGLHGTNDPDPDDCEIAQQKAWLLRQFGIVNR